MMYDYTSRLTILLWFYDDCTLTRLVSLLLEEWKIKELKKIFNNNIIIVIIIIFGISIFFVMPYFDESYAIKKDSKNNNDPGYDYEFNIELFWI